MFESFTDPLSGLNAGVAVQNLLWVLCGLAILLAIHVINWLSNYRLNRLGILPRRLSGLPGIVFSPWLHANFNHLFFNAVPLFMLANFILFENVEIFFSLTGIVVVLSGILVWLFGRPAYHVGASSLVMGYWGFLLLNAYNQRTALAIILGVVCVYYLGGLLINLIPGKRGVSWEGHVFGFGAGLVANYWAPALLDYWHNLSQ